VFNDKLFSRIADGRLFHTMHRCPSVGGLLAIGCIQLMQTTATDDLRHFAQFYVDSLWAYLQYTAHRSA